MRGLGGTPRVIVDHSAAIIDVATHAGRSRPDRARWVIDHHPTITTVHAAGTRRHTRQAA